MRSYLGTRYDAGKNVYDMDFSMKLKERATLLDSREYATWRQTGSHFFKCSDYTQCYHHNVPSR